MILGPFDLKATLLHIPRLNIPLIFSFFVFHNIYWFYIYIEIHWFQNVNTHVISPFFYISDLFLNSIQQIICSAIFVSAVIEAIYNKKTEMPHGLKEVRHILK